MTDVNIVGSTVDPATLHTFINNLIAEMSALTTTPSRAIGDGTIGPIFSQIKDLYHAATHGNDPKRRAWCTPVFEAVAVAG